VMKINTELGYMPVPFSELTQDDQFWKGCASCPNYAILQEKQRKMCLCTGMLAPSKLEEIERKMRFDLTNQIIVENQKNGKANGSSFDKEEEYREFKPVRFATDFF
jgi:hypothetical protein